MHETKKFQKEKEEVLRKIKREAAMNILKEKMAQDAVSVTPLDPANVKTLPPTPCVVLQPVATEENTPKVPVIIAGNPEQSLSLLKDKKVRKFIENQVAENQEAASSNGATAIVLNTISANPQGIDDQPQKSRSKFAPIRMREERPEVMQQEIDPNILLQMAPGESRRFRVMDLLFDRSKDEDDETSQIPLPEPVPGDSELGVILCRGKEDNQNVVFFDPDGLKQELDIYKAETKQLRKDNYELKIKNQVLRNERKKLQKKIQIR